MAATVAVVTGVGMLRLLKAPIELDNGRHADQDGPVMGSADAHVEQPDSELGVGFFLVRLQLQLDVESRNS